MSTLKVDTITTISGTGNINLSRPIAGDGSNLTGISPTKATIEALGIDLPAANLTGTVADARFPATLPASSGVNLTALNASNISSGTLPAGRYTDTVYTHPTGAGNKHIPTAGATDQVLTYSSSGTAAWADPAATSVCVQVKYASNNTYSSATGVAMPFDDTEPQATEGHNCGIDVAITPDSASNILVIEGIVLAAHSGSGDMQIALYQDSGQAIWASKVESSNTTGNQFDQQKVFHVMLAGTTSATTFKVRTGPPSSGGTTYINGGNTAGRKMGGVSRCSLVVREYTP